MTILLLIQSDLWNMHKQKRLDLSNEPIKAEHNQTHRDEGIASSHVTFLHSRHTLQTLLKLNGLREARETPTPTVTLPTGVAVGQCFNDLFTF